MALPEDYYAKVVSVPYPPICTKKAWKKKKSFLDKAMDATKTGLGAELDKAEAAYNKIVFEKLHAAAQGPWKSEDQIDAAKILGEIHYDHVVKPAIKAFDAASKLALKVSLNKDLSKSARDAAKLIAHTLDSHTTVWNSIDFDDFSAEISKRRKLLDIAKAPLKDCVADLEGRLRALRNNPVRSGWDQKLVDSFRSVGNALGNVPEFADIWPVWQKFDGLQAEAHPNLHKGAKEDAVRAAILELIEEVRPHLKTLKRRLDA